MIDVFIRTNTAIADIAKALSGFDCNRVQIRNGGPTEIWQRTAEGWVADEPGMTLYEALCADYVSLAAYRADACGSVPLEDVPHLLLEGGEAKQWLAYMERYRYALEDAIGCTVSVEHQDKEIVCASALFPLSEFKSLHRYSAAPTELAKMILSWVDRALAAGADQVDAAIAIASK
ncbi:hypothetical protein [Stutzerimonas frequens]|uniref:hypothetical protein n=1 Tax=Stutzerimonas frequens TaxID=2968969 RepID=UPI001AAED41A|nr:hypothetical protein [Stutzerimonas frequens]QTF59099.1 hypothetical protein J4H94_21025 [Stutzerimonas frequens]